MPSLEIEGNNKFKKCYTCIIRKKMKYTAAA
jgi:hypothetical protein